MSRPASSNRVEIRVRFGVPDLVQRVDPRYTVSPEAEELLNDLVDEFITSVTRQACRLAASRTDLNRPDGSSAEVKVERYYFMYALQHEWGIVLGLQNPTVGGARVRSTHREALAAVEAAQAAPVS